jgi:hypothetical protein
MEDEGRQEAIDARLTLKAKSRGVSLTKRLTRFPSVIFHCVRRAGHGGIRTPVTLREHCRAPGGLEERARECREGRFGRELASYLRTGSACGRTRIVAGTRVLSGASARTALVPSSTPCVQAPLAQGASLLEGPESSDWHTHSLHRELVSRARGA